MKKEVWPSIHYSREQQSTGISHFMHHGEQKVSGALVTALYEFIPLSKTFMKHHLPSRLGLLARSAVALSSFAACTIASHAVTVTLTTGDALGETSFDSGLHWSDSTPPSAANDYVVAVPSLRTPPATGNFTFGGNSLTLNTGGGLLTKTTTPASTFTINNFTVDGGSIQNANNAGIASTFNGNSLTVGASGATIQLNNGSLAFASTATLVNGTIAVTGVAANTVSFTGAVAFGTAGKLSLGVTPSGALTATSVATFDIGTSGTTYISGNGTNNLSLNGTFNFTLGPEDFVTGNSWTIVSGGTVNETYGGTFSIGNFTNNSGIWTSNDGNYQFTQLTGVLSVVPEPGAFAMTLGGLGMLLGIQRTRRARHVV